MAEQAVRDQNHVTAMLFKGSDGGTYNTQGDELTGRLKVDLAGSIGTVTSITQGTGILLSPSPITTTGSVSLATSLQPAVSLTGNSLKFLRVNVGETAVEYATVSSGLVVGTTTITSGTTTRILYDNAGVLGEYTITGSGTVVAMANSPVFTTPNIGAATGTSVTLSSLTAGRVTFAGTSGLLSDDADFTFATDTLTVTKIAATQFTGNITTSAVNIVTDTTTGTKIGTATNQKLGFFNSTPIIQPTGDVVTALQNLGLGASLTIAADTVSSANEATDTTCFPLFITASGTQTLQPKNNTTLTFNSNTSVLGATIFNAGTGFQIGGAASSGKILKANGTNFVASTETYAAPSTSGNVMTSDGTNWTSAAPAAGSGTPTMKISTTFETSGRFTDSGTGTATFGTGGLSLDTTTSTTRYKMKQWFQGTPNTVNVFAAGGIFSCSLTYDTAGTTSAAFFGLGDCNISGSGITFGGFKQIGFKILNVSGTASVYATTTNASENASSALTTIVAGDALDLIVQVVSTSSVNFYWRKNGGSLSAATNLTTQIPTVQSGYISFGVSNGGTTQQTVYMLNGATFER